jgi:hypothetical protein
MHAAEFGKSAVETLMPGLFSLYIPFGGSIPGLTSHQVVKGRLTLKLSNMFGA